MLNEIARNDHERGLGEVDAPGVFDRGSECRLQRGGVKIPAGPNVPGKSIWLAEPGWLPGGY